MFGLRLFRRSAALLLVCAGSPLVAQDLSISSISTTTLGNVASAPSGDTVLRIDPASGMVSKVSGSGRRVSIGSARSLVTVACGDKNKCNKDRALIVITAVGSPTARAKALTNFTASGATATIVGSPTTGNSISFLIEPIGQNGTKTFWVGFDFPFAGNETGLPTGSASTNFVVTISDDKGKDPYSSLGSVTATVFRPIAVQLLSDLAFGVISRPHTGSGSVSIDAATGARTLAGAGVQPMGSPATSVASYSVGGEGGQVFSVTVPQSFPMTGSPGTLTVTTSTTATGFQMLSGSLGAGGTATFNVGGTISVDTSTALGPYSGSFAVTVQYN